jgi:hypothetical protein
LILCESPENLEEEMIVQEVDFEELNSLVKKHVKEKSLSSNDFTFNSRKVS